MLVHQLSIRLSQEYGMHCIERPIAAGLVVEIHDDVCGAFLHDHLRLMTINKSVGFIGYFNQNLLENHSRLLLD
jgi:hypothetical protein